MYLGQAAPFHFDTPEHGSSVDLPQLLVDGLNSPDLAAFLAAQAPQHREYQALKAALAEYRQIEHSSTWPQIPAGPTIRAGMVDQRLDVLAQRLHLSGDLPYLPQPVYVERADAPQENLVRVRVYDEVLVNAVKRFQGRCNLAQDGSVGPKTLAALNMSPAERLKKIVLNLDRWRRLPHHLTGHHLLVNIASFDLSILYNGHNELSMPVIVGKNSHETPVFSHAMRYIEVNPYWNIPSSIARKEIVKKMQEDPTYLRRQHIRIFAGWSEHAPEIPPAAINWYTIGANIRKYRLRQDPGKGNALGTIKFMFPNRKNIYLHDTPGHSLFQRTQRTFSHGCVRVSRPLDLAWQILHDDGQNISKERLQHQIASGKQAIFILKQPLPVHLVYLTVRVSEDGVLHFYDDVYDRDKVATKALRKKR
jgi:L,D-transpeptidase YcbB